MVRRAVPLGYLAVAMAVAVLVLPTALRPPPDPSNESGAISPDAPPDNNPEQLIQSVQQAAGGGAGAAAGGATTTTAAPLAPGVTQPVVTTTTIRRKAGLGSCFGTPKRQTESIYAPPCQPAFVGDNGGETAHNVLANELHLSFNHALGAPPDGPVPEQPASGEGSETRTMRVLQTFVNQRYETYGRKIRFYGTAAASDDTAALATSSTADTQYKVFAAYNLAGAFCQDMARRHLVVFCDPQSHDVYVRNRPGFFSWQMDFDQMFGFGAEYYCKRLKGKPAAHAGGLDLNASRKVAIISEQHADFGIPASRFQDAVVRECNGHMEDVVELAPGSADGAAAAIAKLRADGVTTVILNTTLANTLYLMSAAGQYQPEWVLLGNEGLDFNTVAELLPANQSVHLFGVSGWELARRPDDSECYRAYKSIDPDNDPNQTTCTVFWHPMNMMMAGIQLAGPKLTPDAFQKALFSLGHRYEQTPWAIGGGYGPDDYSYMDSVGEIWFDAATQNPETGAPGAYRWTSNGKRYRRGQFDGDASGLFVSGVASPPAGT